MPKGCSEWMVAAVVYDMLLPSRFLVPRQRRGRRVALQLARAGMPAIDENVQTNWPLSRTGHFGRLIRRLRKVRKVKKARKARKVRRPELRLRHKPAPQLSTANPGRLRRRAGVPCSPLQLSVCSRNSHPCHDSSWHQPPPSLHPPRDSPCLICGHPSSPGDGPRQILRGLGIARRCRAIPRRRRPVCRRPCCASLPPLAIPFSHPATPDPSTLRTMRRTAASATSL